MRIVIAFEVAARAGIAAAGPRLTGIFPFTMEPPGLNLVVGWSSMIAGALAGAVIGLYFHDESWMGGYTSLRRRMVRLGHISFFGLGFLNVLFALTLAIAPIPLTAALWGSIAFALAAVTMPLCCFLTAWRPALRHLFPIPVAAVLAGLGSLFAGWVMR